MHHRKRVCTDIRFYVVGYKINYPHEGQPFSTHQYKRATKSNSVYLLCYVLRFHLVDYYTAKIVILAVRRLYFYTYFTKCNKQLPKVYHILVYFCYFCIAKQNNIYDCRHKETNARGCRTASESDKNRIDKPKRGHRSRPAAKLHAQQKSANPPQRKQHLDHRPEIRSSQQSKTTFCTDWAATTTAADWFLCFRLSEC